NAVLESYLERRGLAGRVSMDSVRDLIGEGAGKGMARVDPAVLPLLQQGLSGGLQLVFWAIALFAAAALLVSWRVRDLPAETVAEAGRPPTSAPRPAPRT